MWWCCVSHYGSMNMIIAVVGEDVRVVLSSWLLAGQSRGETVVVIDLVEVVFY